MAVTATTPIELVEIEPGRLAIMHVAEPGSRKADTIAFAGHFYFNETDIGQEPRYVRGIDVTLIGHRAAAGFVEPIFIKLAMLGNNQLRLEGRIHLSLRHPSSPFPNRQRGARFGLMNRCILHRKSPNVELDEK